MNRICGREKRMLPAKRGRPSIGKSPKKDDLLRLYVTKGMSIREVAYELGCSKDMVSRALKSYMIEARDNAKRSGLRGFAMRTLEASVRAKGVRGIARDIGVNPSTLSRFLRSKIGK